METATINIEDTFKKVEQASRKLNLLSETKINKVLEALADKAEENIPSLLEANQKDLDRMDSDDPKFDRLKLTEERIKDIASDIRNIASMASPLGRTLSEKSLENGLTIQRISVPLGVIGIIYEARPNVTFDVFSLCLKSGNACILKGGSDAEYSNKAILGVIHEVLKEQDINTGIVDLLPTDRSATQALLEAVDYVDIIIPRGSQGLINYVRQNAKVPVIETGAGIVHTYYDEFADAEKGRQIVNNSKTRRVSVCNALDCLLIHESRLEDLPNIGELLKQSDVEIFADEKSYAHLDGKYPAELLKKADKEHFGTEFLSYKMAIKTVGSIDEAIEHVSEYSSKHSEAIVSEKQENLDLYMKSVDAAAVYANASTAFTDGAQFGLGAEIGISTQKLHARGPMALNELTSYKWVVTGQGQIRP